MNRRALLVLTGALAACTGPSATRAGSAPLTTEQTTAIRDSVQTFLNAYAAALSAPPIGSKAREAMAGFLAADVVMATDLGGDEPVLLQTLDAVVPADEVVSQPAWIKGTRLEFRSPVITPLAPGLAMITSRYAEVVTDTTGTVTELPGVQQIVVRNAGQGWRIAAIESAHPAVTHQRQAGLGAKFAGPAPAPAK